MRKARKLTLTGYRAVPWLVLAGCRAAAPLAPPPPAPPPAVYVHPKGDDRDTGRQDAPFRTVARALAAGQPKVRVHAGVYPVGRLFITRPVELVATSTGTVLKGSIFITASDTHLEGVTVEGGLDAAQSDGLSVKNVEVHPVGRDDTLTIVGSTGTLEALRVRCGEETCIHVTTSTVTMNGTRLTGGPATRRGLRISNARVQAEDLRIQGARIAQVQVELQGELALRDAELTGSRGSAVVAIREARVDLDRVKTSSIANTAILAQTSSVTAKNSIFAPTGGQTISVSGGFVRLEQSKVVAGAAAANLKSFDDIRGGLHLIDCIVVHGDRDGILGSGSVARIERSVFQGQPGAGRGHAISLRGPGAQAFIEDSRLIAPAGFGLELVDGASGRMTGTITAPGQGGIRVRGALGASVIVDRTTIQNCVSGPALSVLDSDDVRITGGRLSGCPGGGVIAGQRSRIAIDDAHIETRGRYGVAAFGGSRVVVRSSTVTGAPWAIFSACADSSLVVDAGRNRFAGGRGECL